MHSNYGLLLSIAINVTTTTSQHLKFKNITITLFFNKVHDNHPKANSTSEKIQCITPAFERKGLYIVEFSLNGPDFSVTVPKKIYAYYLNPKVSRIDPELGPAEGNTEVKIYSDSDKPFDPTQPRVRCICVLL